MSLELTAANANETSFEWCQYVNVLKYDTERVETMGIIKYIQKAINQWCQVDLKNGRLSSTTM